MANVDLVSPPWICDKCGERIETVAEGWIEWLDSGRDNLEGYHSLRLVHAVRCIRDSDRVYRQTGQLTHDLGLDHYIGADGFMRWMIFLHQQSFKDIEEIAEMMKRLYIPGYEHAREHIAEAIANNIIDPPTHERYPFPDTIQSILDWANNR